MSSCHFQQFANIANLHQISSYLFNEPESEPWDDDDDGWTNSWDFAADVSPKDKELDLLQSCCFAFSPTGDFLCFAYKQKAVFVSTQNSRGTEQLQMDICFKGALNDSPEETITCVLCLPIASLKRTSHGSRDWTCTLVGFSSGYIRMYSESGGLLISELLHESPVLEFGCRTSDTIFNVSYNGSAEHHDELTILYADSLISLDGLSLFDTLRVCRSQLAVATAQGTIEINPPLLSYKKWVLRGQEKITTHLNVGIISPSSFDQMRSACIREGFSADVKSGSTAINQFAAGGSTPFMGFYYATEGSTQPLFSHVAIAVASKLKSALFTAASGWLGWGQRSSAEDQSKPKPKPKIEVGTGLDIRCGLPDVLRTATAIIVAPGANWLAATSDTFGRVMLLDLVKAKAIRMWKGYRDAQIAFIQTNDDDEESKSFHHPEGEKKRMALFLVIYAPRRGILEVWSCINGPRVATFNIGKNSKLVYPGFGLFGLPSKKQSGHFNTRLVQCCLVDGDGSIKELSVPFHLALSDAKSNKARDIHLLKSVSRLLQTGRKEDIDEVTKLILGMRLASVQMQAVKKLLQLSSVESESLKSHLLEISEHLKAEESKKEVRDLIEYLESQMSLLNVHMAVEKLNKISNRFNSEPLQESACKDLAREFIITSREAEKIVELLMEFQNSSPCYAEKESSPISSSDFLRCFIVNPGIKPQYNLAANECLIQRLSSFIFHSSLFCGIPPCDVMDAIESNITISKKEILSLVFECWKNHEKDILHSLLESSRCLKRFVECLSEDSDDGDEELKWREWIKLDICSPSKSVLSSYTIALVSRSVEVARRSDKVTSPQDGDEEPPSYDEVVGGVKPPTATGWETLWPELENWNILTKQSEDCLVINTALCKAGNDKVALQLKTESIVSRVSVYDLLHNGPGYIPELIAEDVCALSIQPDALFDASKSDQDDENNHGEFLKYFHSKLIPSFPTLLSSNSLHAHCFWHEMVTWNRDPEVVAHFKKAILHVGLISSDILLQQGISLMAWRTFVVKKFIALAKLIEKVGKAPKDRLLRKETSMSDKSVPTFCRCCSQILQVIADSDPDGSKPAQGDEVYDGSSSLILSDDTWLGVQGKESIVNMGREQPIANQALLQLNMYLSFIMDGVMAFSLRSTKPLTQLFNSTNRNHLLSDLSTSHLFHQDFIDADISGHRKKFLFKVIRGAVKKLHSSPDDHILREDTSDWIDTCVHMAAEFLIDYSLVRIQHVCELVKHGMDEMAFDHLKATGNDEILASRLIIIIGQRLNHILFTASPEDGARMTAQMSTTLSSWIRAQASKDLDVLEVPVESTLLLARELPPMLTEEHEQYALSEFLIEALSVVVNS